MRRLPYLDLDTPFPHPSTAFTEPDGLLAFGADLSVSRLVNAYANGIFPWFSEGEPIMWWSPSVRAIIPLERFVLSRSLAKLVRQKRYKVTINHAFSDVIVACAKTPRQPLHGNAELQTGTWITDDMIEAYCNLHANGLAHSVEVWDAHELVGGLYGVAIGNAFCGESMFHQQSNTSKLALYALNTHLMGHEHAFIDCQMPTEHLMSLGAQAVSREQYLAMLAPNKNDFFFHGELNDSYQRMWKKRDITP